MCSLMILQNFDGRCITKSTQMFVENSYNLCKSQVSSWYQKQ